MQILGPVDTAFLMVETPESPMNIGALTIFEGKIPFDAFLKLIDARIYQVPLYQQRIIQAPLSLGQPMWAFDPDFYVGNHVFRVQLEPPGTDEQLRELAGHLVSGMLDRNRPLWEIHMIEGLEGDRTGVFFKIHHCMVDGLAAIELFTLLLDLTPEVSPNPRKPVYDPPYLPGPGDLIVESFKRDIPHKFNMVKKVGSDLLSLASVFADKEKRLKALIGMAYLVNGNLKPIGKLPINGKNTGKITLGWAEFSLAEVRAIRSGRNASVNDVMLSVLAGALDRYIRQVGEKIRQAFVRVLVPVNMRVEDEKGEFGNRISVLPIDIPFGIDDPLERLRVVSEYTQVMKDSSLSKGLDLVLTIPSLMPSVAQPLIWQVAPMAFSLLAHTWCTNVAGPQIPIYLLGHQMQHTFGYFPLNPSMGLACVIASYNQKISMTLVADAGIVPDVTDLADHLKRVFLSLRRAAKVPEMEPVVIERSRAEPAPPRTAEITPPAVSGVSDIVEAPLAAEVAPQASTIEDRADNADDEAGMTEETPAVVDTETVPITEHTNGFDAISQAEMAGAPMVEVPVEAPAANGHILVGQAEPAALPVVDAEPDQAAAKQPEAGVLPTRAEPPAKPRLFSQEWAQAYREAINQNRDYYKASTRWEAGALAFIMKAAPRYGFQRDAAVLMDLHKGVCRGARSLPPTEANAEAAFIIEGDYPSWMEVLSGRTPPLVMIMRGKLRLKKGSLTRLLPFTQSAQELIRSAQMIS
ncbi:MAG: wax ester/triacylglycerol synthase family O-acyltransferase [Chloroflexi bacterium]|nr:wax ester/triacylglycerol synthase family O-acyltransferase [Chloroflexota bacterium]